MTEDDLATWLLAELDRIEADERRTWVISVALCPACGEPAHDWEA